MKPLQFTATIYNIGINYAVDVPQEVSLTFKKRGYVPVVGSVNGFPLRATLVPIGEGRHRLFLNGETRKTLGIGDGDVVEISVGLDKEPRIRPMPPEFLEALDKNKEAMKVWEKLPPSRQKEILAYLNNLKSPEALKRNIEKVISNHLRFYR